MYTVIPKCASCGIPFTRYRFGDERGWTCEECQTLFPDLVPEVTTSTVDLEDS